MPNVILKYSDSSVCYLKWQTVSQNTAAIQLTHIIPSYHQAYSLQFFAKNNEHAVDVEHHHQPIWRGELFGEVAVRVEEEALLCGRDLAAGPTHSHNWVAHLQCPRVHYFTYLNALRWIIFFLILHAKANTISTIKHDNYTSHITLPCLQKSYTAS